MARAVRCGRRPGPVAVAALVLASGVQLGGAAAAQAADEESLSEDFDQVRCDVMGMSGYPTATYIEEGSHGPFLQDGNEWIALTLTSAVGDTEVPMPVYGQTYSAIADDVIIEITLCQGTPRHAVETDGVPGADDELVGPPVETDGPSTDAGPGAVLIAGAALVLAGAGAAAFALLRRPPRSA